MTLRVTYNNPHLFVGQSGCRRAGVKRSNKQEGLHAFYSRLVAENRKQASGCTTLQTRVATQQKAQAPLYRFPATADAPPIEMEPLSRQKWAERWLPGDLENALPDNWVRDFTWTSLAAMNVGCDWRMLPPLDTTSSIATQITNPAFVQPMLSQWAYSTIPMGLIASYQTYQAYKKDEVSKENMIKIWVPVGAASLAIPMWDLGQTVGAAIGTASFPDSSLWYGANIAGGLIAAPFTGIFEGFTQWSVRYLVDVATNPVTREMWRQDCRLMSKVLVKEFFLNVTIGAIPGAVWQIVWFFVFAALAASLPFTWAVILTALAVATAVMLCNFVCTHAINKASDSIDKYFGWDEQLIRLRKLAAEKLELQKLKVAA